MATEIERHQFAIINKNAQMLLRMSRSYGIVWNSRAACWRWLFQTQKFVWFLLVRDMVLIYSPDGTDVYGLRDREIV